MHIKVTIPSLMGRSDQLHVRQELGDKGWELGDEGVGGGRRSGWELGDSGVGKIV